MIKLDAMRAISAQSDARELIFKNLPTKNQTTRAIIISTGKKNASTPAPVATPLPPWKPKNIEKQCPATLKTAIVQSVLWLAPREEAMMSGKTPFNTSQTTVKMASFLASFGLVCFKTLKTFVAPMLLLPSFFISTCPKIFASMSPDGMLPSR